MKKFVSKITDKIKDGNFFNNYNKNDIVISAKLLEKLEAKLADNIVVLVSCYECSMGDMKFRIGGIMKSGQSETDTRILYMHIETAYLIHPLISLNLSILSNLNDKSSYALLLSSYS